MMKNFTQEAVFIKPRKCICFEDGIANRGGGRRAKIENCSNQAVPPNRSAQGSERDQQGEVVEMFYLLTLYSFWVVKLLKMCKVKGSLHTKEERWFSMVCRKKNGMIFAKRAELEG